MTDTNAHLPRHMAKAAEHMADAARARQELADLVTAEQKARAELVALLNPQPPTKETPP